MHARVLTAYDGSERSLSVRPIARRVAATLGCPEQLVHVADDGTAVHEPDMELVDAPDPAAGLISAVRSTDPPGLLCMSTRGRGAIGEMVFGSVASQVIRDLHAPLLVVGPKVQAQPKRAWQRMLVCLDGSATAASILPVARAWADRLPLSITLLTITYPLGDPRTADLGGSDEASIVAAELRRTAAELAAAGIEVDDVVADDTDPALGITRQAAHRGADLIAMATHGRTGLARLVAGSVALATVKQTTVPTLVLRPPLLH